MDLEQKNSQRHIDSRQCFQLSSTDDRRQYGHIITISVHLCVQHYGRSEARRPGVYQRPADFCFLYDLLHALIQQVVVRASH